jgi:tetratricopeptide (TPR) repeat protein
MGGVSWKQLPRPYQIKIMKYFVPTVFGAAAVIMWQSQVMAQSIAEIESIVQPVTVKIESANPSGSGVIIGRNQNIYYVLTARHVIEGIIPGEEAYIITNDHESHNINTEQIEKLTNNLDLALVKFSSEQNYPVATISKFNYRLYEGRDYEHQIQAKSPDRQYVFVTGFPQTTSTTTKKVFNPGILFDNSASAISQPDTSNSQDNFGGYDLVYTNLTYTGMSGGGVFDTQGRLVGIHGRADGRKIGREDEIIREYLDEVGEEEVKIKVGLSLGIPIQSFLTWAANHQLNNYLKVEASQPQVFSQTSTDSWQPPLSVTDPANPYHWLEKGNQLWRVGKMAEARGAFNKAIQLREDLYLAWFAKGFAAGFDGQYQQALEACDRALALKITPAIIKYESYRCKAGALQQLQQVKPALDALDQALVINDQNPVDWMLQGELRFALKQYQEALTSFNSAIALRQSQQLTPSPLLHNNLGLVRLQLKDYDLALEAIETAIALEPNFAPAWRNKGLVLETINRNQEVIAAYDQALKITPDDYNTWTNRGFTLYKLKQYQAAKASFEQALKINPNYQPAISNLEALTKQK